MTIGVIGAGAFGTALAISLGEGGPVALWARDPNQAAKMQRDRKNATRLPGAVLPDTVTATSDLADLRACKITLLCVPMQKLRGFLSETQTILPDAVLVACCKGMELNTGAGPLDVIAQVMPSHERALLTGPSFAADIAKGLPTALTLACENGQRCEELQNALSTSTLRLYRTTDTRGASLGGALKNVIAIACGAAIGAGLGESARAALMTRGNAEMQRLAHAMGADPMTLSGLSGFGDLVLTCTSELSRNYRFGLSIGAGSAFDPSITVEGAATAIAVTRKARDMGIEMPISAAVAGLVEKKLDVTQAMAALLARSLKEE